MQIRVLGAFGGSTPGHRQTSFLIDGRVALDAGALTESLSLKAQADVRAVIVTHSHMDHLASLPFFIENVFGRTDGPIEVIAPAEVTRSIKTHLFNNDLWPDFSRIPDNLPVVRFRVVEAGVPFRVNGLTAVAVPVRHVVPTFGYLISDGAATVLFSGDTGPTEALWQAAHAAPNLKAMFVECSFPDDMKEIAEVSLHLTPATLRGELAKFPRGVPVNLYHMKPPTLARLAEQVAALEEPRLRMLADDDVLAY